VDHFAAVNHLEAIHTSSPGLGLSVLDLFSGAGGMSYGFHAHPAFRLVGAIDAEIGKPSQGVGALGCNASFARNIGLAPTAVNLATISDAQIDALAEGLLQGAPLDVLSACPPCTGFSRANPANHALDDPRNSLVVGVARWVERLRPSVLVMENARELLHGRFSHHFETLRHRLSDLGYDVSAKVHLLNRYGLAQRRERTLVIATTRPTGAKDLDDLWAGYAVRVTATTVRRAIGHLPALAAGQCDPADSCHVSPRLTAGTLARITAIAHDGGSWRDLRGHPNGVDLMTPAMVRAMAAGDFGSHPDVYGRLAWDAPAPTIKRECAHVGNGRYSHPQQDRLCTVRELALLQGFPDHYRFTGACLANRYRHIGDAVPPLISFQLANLVAWIWSGRRPDLSACVLPGTHLRAVDIVPAASR
jgi:DNA (cytosine-5)-methyltransferase 1